MEILLKLPDATGSGKPKMAACKLEIRISQLDGNKMATKFQRQYLCLGVQLTNEFLGGNVVRPNGKEPEVENPRCRPVNLKYLNLNLYTRWQQNSNSYTYVFWVQLSNGSDDNVA